MESEGEEYFWSESKYTACTQVVICCRKSELDRGMYCISEGTESIWYSGQVESRASVKSVPRVSNNAFELQHIV